MKQTKLVIFDWDGTLMDSIEHIINSLQYAMSRMQIEVLDRDTTKDIIGLGMRESVETLFPNDSKQKGFFEQFTNYYREHFLTLDKQTPLFPETERTLQNLLERGFVLAVATSKSRKGLDRIFRDVALGQYFATSQCADETRSKPHPDMLNVILGELNVRPENAIMVGDTEYDVKMAHNANMDSIAVTYGVHNEERLLKNNPSACIDNLDNLIGCINSF